MPPLSKLFFDQGNTGVHEDVRALRLAKITSVNTSDMVVDIEFLGESSGKTRVPLPMPMAYPGGGIFTVPTKGAIVVVGIRAMQFPLILAYYPSNIYTPDSFFAQWKQIFGMPENLSEGDIFIRSRSNVSRCDRCNQTFTEDQWEAAIDRQTLVELCPNCSAPAIVLNDFGGLVRANKRPFGMSLIMTATGKVLFQGNNLSIPGDADRLVKVAIDGVTGDVTTTGARNFSVAASGTATLDCGKIVLRSATSIEETANSRVYNTNQTIAESSLDRLISAAGNLSFSAQTVNLAAAGSINVSANVRSTNIADQDVYVTKDLGQRITGDRTTDIGGDDEEDIDGSKALNVGADLGTTVVGGATLSVGEDYDVTITGALNETVTGKYTIQVADDFQITSTAQVKITGTSVILNSGTLAVARKTDATQVNSTTDAAFFTFLGSLITFLTTFKATYNGHTHASVGGPAVPQEVTSPPSAPSTVTGAITGGNNTVKA